MQLVMIPEKQVITTVFPEAAYCFTLLRASANSLHSPFLRAFLYDYVFCPLLSPSLSPHFLVAPSTLVP